MNDLGIEAAHRGETEVALAHFRESLASMIDLEENVYIAHPLASMASVLAAGGQVAVATRVLGAVVQSHATNRTFPWNTERARDEQTMALARATLGEARFNAEFAAGRRLSVADAARQAMTAVDLL
jgi:hypothetical protein